MKFSGSDIRQGIKRTIESDTPDVLSNVLLRIENQEKIEYTEYAKPVKSKKTALYKWAGCFAALLIIIIGINAGYGYYSVESIISFDVNPSIELRINSSEKVLSAVPLNDEAQNIIGDMNLKNTDLDVAVNAIIGAMVVNGYIDEVKNTILISVDSNDEQKGIELQQRILADVDSLLASYSVNGAVLSQTITDDEYLQALADEYGITLGKATLIDSLLKQDSSLDFESLAGLPLNDIYLLIESNETDINGVDTTGVAGSGEYIGENKAGEIAFNHSGIQQSTVTSYKVKIDYDDGVMIYKIEFKTEKSKYKYEIDALTGTILEFKHD